MSLSSLVATLGYYPIGGRVGPEGPKVGVLYKRVEEDERRPLIKVKNVTCEDFVGEVNISVVSVKSVG
jgi:hypothetical protein